MDVTSNGMGLFVSILPPGAPFVPKNHNLRSYKYIIFCLSVASLQLLDPS